MKDGFFNVAAFTPKLRVADCAYNTQQILAAMDEAHARDIQLLVFPELAVTGYTCGDLFLTRTLQDAAAEGLKKIAQKSAQQSGMLAFVGLPLLVRGKLYNVAAAVYEGKVIAFIPKRNLPNYNEFYERRQFTPGAPDVSDILFDGQEVPFGGNILLSCTDNPDLCIGAELCEDLWVPLPPSVHHALAGASVIVNLSASNDLIGKADYRRALVSGQAARLVAAYVYCSSGKDESTQDIVFSGHRLIAENGTILAESERFTDGVLAAQLDLQKLTEERARMTTFATETAGYRIVPFSMKSRTLHLTRRYDRTPFVPDAAGERDRRCSEILQIQSMGLRKRLAHIGCSHAVIGISGGLDSTLALLVTARAFDALGLDRKGILCVTMPAFGTTDRTYNNAVTLTRQMGCTLREINIRKAVRQHFEDIGQDESNHDVTYENSQARERTQILMDLANMYKGIVIGTGDLSELALGWATYNGDHMSMYGVNASVPKTLVRYLVRYAADTCGDKRLQKALMDVLDTPVSPELLPPEDGQISQKTEDLVGPYELHDFFLYHTLRFGVHPKKLFRIAQAAFAGEFSPQTIYKWQRTFTWRFFAQQYKRSCLPDSPKVGTVAVSPRGDLRMPSDASGAVWMAELDEIEKNLTKEG
ncbi:MAG: NAD(+) synthase [Lachnospiraceae bacterium]|nr:NAD(+) synthase [Lachnospiraceae bacterium]